MKVTYKDVFTVDAIRERIFPQGWKVVNETTCSECKESNMFHSFDREGVGETSPPGTLQKRRNFGH